MRFIGLLSHLTIGGCIVKLTSKTTEIGMFSSSKHNHHVRFIVKKMAGSLSCPVMITQSQSLCSAALKGRKGRIFHVIKEQNGFVVQDSP